MLIFYGVDNSSIDTLPLKLLSLRLDRFSMVDASTEGSGILSVDYIRLPSYKIP